MYFLFFSINTLDLFSIKGLSLQLNVYKKLSMNKYIITLYVQKFTFLPLYKKTLIKEFTRFHSIYIYLYINMYTVFSRLESKR